MLPTFVGLGAMRSGTSWLDHQLRHHPEVYVPTRRKEVHFFDEHYHRGPDWYASFFPDAAEAARYTCLGEITPRYLFDPEVPARLHAHLPDAQLLVILRDPAVRAYSQYKLAARDNNFDFTFEAFLERSDEIIERGCYHTQLTRFLAHYPREQFLILFFEQVMARPAEALARLAAFLGIAPEGFTAADTGAVNASHTVRLGGLYALAARAGAYLRAQDADWVVNAINRSGVLRLFESRRPFPPMAPEVRARLYDRYRPEVEALEALLDVDLSSWKAPRDAS